MEKAVKFENNYPYNYIITGLGLITCSIGLALGIIVLYLILKNSWRRLNIDLKLVAITMVVDVISCFFGVLIALVALIFPTDYLDTFIGCGLSGSFSTALFGTSINLVAVIGIQRCLLVVYDIHLKLKHYLYMLIPLVTSNFSSIVIAWTMNGFGKGKYGYFCYTDPSSTGGIPGFSLFAITFGISVNIVYFSYIKIIIKQAENSRVLQNELGEEYQKISKKHKASMLKSWAIIIIYTINNMPINVQNIISAVDDSIKLPWLAAMSGILMSLNQVFNTVLVLQMRPDILDEFKLKLALTSFKEENVNNSLSTTNKINIRK